MFVRSEFSLTSASLVLLTTITSLLIAMRCTADRLTADLSHFASPLEEVEFWIRALGG